MPKCATFILNPAGWENPVPPDEGRATLEACLHDTPGHQALRAVPSTGRPLGRQKGWRKHPNGAQAP